MIMDCVPPGSGQLGLLFLAALAGGVHCAGMCGPYVAVCSARIAPPGASPRGSRLTRLVFNLGRLATYVAIGTLAGAVGQIAGGLAQMKGVTGIVSIATGSVAVAAAVSIAGWFPGFDAAVAMFGIAPFIREGSRRVTGAPRLLSAAALGALQGLLPCALVYGAASRAAATASAAQGALTMLVFGLGTLPALLALTFAGAALPAWTRSRAVAASMIGLLGGLMILRGVAGLGVIPHSRFW